MISNIAEITIWQDKPRHIAQVITSHSGILIEGNFLSFPQLRANLEYIRRCRDTLKLLKNKKFVILITIRK
jgi:hypothetical protein